MPKACGYKRKGVGRLRVGWKEVHEVEAGQPVRDDRSKSLCLVPYHEPVQIDCRGVVRLSDTQTDRRALSDSE